MRKGYLLLLLPLLVLALAGTSYGWQGRMGGMGDSYGLVADESDFLIHPAKIAKGEGVKFYGDYRFTYTGVTDWDFHTAYFELDGTLFWWGDEDLSGDEQRHDTLVGAAFPLGPGRMGLFFTYAGMRGDYDGDYGGPSSPESIGIQSDLDDFAFKLLYGLPLDGFQLGGEVQFSYRQEEQQWYESSDYGTLINDFSIPPYIYPYESKYGEALFKGSLEGAIGPLDCEFTLRGGFIFSGANELYYTYQTLDGEGGWDLDGDVQGWRIGSDLWVRYPLHNGLALPFLVRIDYHTKTRDGDGPGFGDSAGTYYDHEHEQKDFALSVGGGVDKEFDKDTRIAAGIYYNYLQGKEDFFFYYTRAPGEWFTEDYTYPDFVEHQALLRFAGERRLSPLVALRAGLSFFYGWVNGQRDFIETNYNGDLRTSQSSGNGSRWGVGASVGGSIQFQRFTLEPFISGGYQQLDLEMDGFEDGTIDLLFEEKSARSEWSIGGGLSILFDL